MQLLPVPDAPLAETHPQAELLARMECAREQLEVAKTLSQVKRIADGAAAIREWLKRQSEVGLSIVNDASLLKLEAEARMGEFLQQPGTVRKEAGDPRKSSQAVTTIPPTHKELGINRMQAQRYEQISVVPRETLRELADDATRRGVELTRETVLKVAQRFRPKPPVSESAEPEPCTAVLECLPPDFRNRIVTGDARELAACLPDESVSLCFCDPVYDRIEDYEWLARECERVLSPGGSVVAQCGTLRRFDAEVAMRRSGLRYVDLLAEVYPYALTGLFHIRVQVGWKPYLWFSKGKRTQGEWVMNRVQAKGKRHSDESKALHSWGDAEQFTEGLLNKLCSPGGLVWDPFTGSGTVPVVARRFGLPFVAFEIDAGVAELACHRLAGTSPVQRAQMSLGFDAAEDSTGIAGGES